jgi:hypothetical protein
MPWQGIERKPTVLLIEVSFIKKLLNCKLNEFTYNIHTFMNGGTEYVYAS